MEVITSHNSLDFDGLAAMVAAGKLYPGAVKAFSGTVAKNVRQFMALYKDSLMIKQAKEIELSKVTRLIIVDTANARRLGRFSSVFANNNLDIHIYDHHPVNTDSLRGSINEIHPTGAATTILVEQIQAQNIIISPLEATILAIGIYEDTGSLLFTSTTARDVHAAAFLLEKGANLAVVANFIEQPFSGEQRKILQNLLNSACHYEISNINVVIAVSETADFIPGLDIITYRLFEVENCDVVFVIALMEGKINIVGRSRTNNVKVNEILKTMGGRGHEKAASAVVKGKSPTEVTDLIIEIMRGNIHPGITAQDIMTSPVKTISMYISMEEAGKIMLRYGHTGMPVVEENQLIGIISRRDVDKAMLHELGHAPVKGFMTSQVVTVAPDTPVGDIQKLMVEYDIGRLPVVQKDKLVGIVSRTDILRTLHGEDFPEDHEILYTSNQEDKGNYKDFMQERLPARVISLLQVAGEVAEGMNCTVYCVGGFVRDLFLQVPNFDIDLVVEGDGQELSRQLAKKLGGKARIHERFRTAVVKLADGTKIDVATARTEYYEFPAALPWVEKSSIKEDMYRRDFTINTMAICLNPVCFGDLIDNFGGRQDLQDGYIRILYNLSFVEDPTRIIRAIRFEQRYNFKIEPDTLRFAREAIERRMLGKLSYKRILQELILILGEKYPDRSLKRMKEIGVWKYILPEVKLKNLDIATLRRISVVLAWWHERYFKINTRAWLVYFMFILSGLSENQIESVLNRYPLDTDAKRCIRETGKIADLAQEITNHTLLTPSTIDKMVRGWSNESIVYLLLCLEDEDTWENVAGYLDLIENTRLDINGHDLRNLGLKPGPHFKVILDELYYLKLDGVIHNREEEINFVKKWIAEGRFKDAIGY